MNESILNWYEFKKNKSALIIGEDVNSLSELLKRRGCIISCINQDEFLNANLSDDFSDNKSFLENFDYIIAPDIDDYNYLNNTDNFLYNIIQTLLNHLKSDGRLFITIKNRYGLKYFCGAPDPHTGVIYDGINNYLQGAGESGDRCYSRNEIDSTLKKIINNAADESYNMTYKFYYPLPDDKMPQMIFTDDYSDFKDVAERFVDYTYAESYFGVSHRIIQDILKEGCISFFANSFMIEITKENVTNDIIYALTTTDRGPKYGMSTTIRQDGSVIKRSLWKEGEEQLKNLSNNLEYLKNNNIPVVNIKSGEDEYGFYISMPFIREESLDEYLKMIIKTNEDKFLKIFDQIYDYIKLSYNDEEKSIFIDLAPCNAFYNEENDEILFYDQEFKYIFNETDKNSDISLESKDDLIKYSIYRTILYFYASSRVAEKYYSSNKLFIRYNVTESDILKLKEVESSFINSVRKIDKNKTLFDMATPDYKKIYQNMQDMTQTIIGNDKICSKNYAQGLTDVENINYLAKPYKVGYVPGVFDLLHVGHLRLFEKCKSRCEYLIVGVLTDELANYYKGRNPVIPYEDRAELIRGLKVVDEVIPVDFRNTDKIAAWEQLHYDCHFSGDDHTGHWNDIWEELKKRGSNMEFFPYTQGISTTMIREKK